MKKWFEMRGEELHMFARYDDTTVSTHVGPWLDTVGLAERRLKKALGLESENEDDRSR